MDAWANSSATAAKDALEPRHGELVLTDDAAGVETLGTDDWLPQYIHCRAGGR